MKKYRSDKVFTFVVDEAYMRQAVEEFERHFRPDEIELYRLGANHDKKLKHIENLYHKNFMSEQTARERLKNKNLNYDRI